MASVPKTQKKSLKLRWGSIDLEFFVIVLCLMTFGLVMMFSASYSWGYYEGDSLVYIRKQLLFTFFGFVGMMLIAAGPDYNILKNKYLTFGIFIFALFLLVLVLFVGEVHGGAKRWLNIKITTFQPSEIMKFAMVLLFSFIISNNYKKMKTIKYGIVPFAVILGIISLLMMLQPHLSGTVIICALGAILMFVGGMNRKHILFLVVSLVIIVLLTLLLLKVLGIDYFFTRIYNWRHPELNPQGENYQTRQSLITIGSGGLFGLGLGNSRQKFRYLPESHNDFVFSIICEELGFVGAMVVIILFVLFILRGLKIASKSKDKFGMLLATGITMQIGLQALLNIGVVTNSIPNTGISLPFFSYGGTALVMQLLEVGVLLNISKHGNLDT